MTKKTHHHLKSKNLQWYAFYTGIFSTFVSLAGVIVDAIK